MRRSTTEHTILGIQCLLAGDSLARYTIWDGMRALDYLLSRPEVDASRIAVTGNSGGGTHTAYLAALDDRIHVAAPSCYLTSWRALLETIGPQDAEQDLLPWIGNGLDHADFIYAFSPKPYLVLSAIRDFFSISGARATYKEASICTRCSAHRRSCRWSRRMTGTAIRSQEDSPPTAGSGAGSKASMIRSRSPKWSWPRKKS